MKRTSIIPGILLLVFPALSYAHDGHGHTEGYTITHYFTEPLHLAITAAILLMSGILVAKRIARNKRKGV